MIFRFFETRVNPFVRFNETTPPDRIWPYVRSHLGNFWPYLGWMAVTGLIVAVSETLIIAYMGRVVDLIQSGDTAGFWSSHGLELAAAGLAVLLVRPAVIFLNSLMLEQILAGAMQDQVRWRAHKHMLGQSMGFFQNDFAGRLSNRVMQLGPAVEDSVFMVFEALWYAAVYVVSAIIIVGDMDPLLAIPMVFWVAGFVGYTWNISVRVGAASEKWSDARSLVTGRIVDAYANIETVKLFGHGASEERYVLSAMKRHRLRFQRFLRLMSEMGIGQNLLNGALMVGMLGPALVLWTNGRVTVGDVAAASALTLRLTGMSGWLMWVAIRFFEHAGVIREGLRSLAVPHAVVDAPDAPALVVERGEIRFEDVTHHYGKGRGGLDDVSLTIPAGQKVGLVGRSGAGKSSLVGLLLRFRDAEAGRITIDGQDVGAVTQDSLRKAIGMVTQDSSLLHRSVRANILYGKPEASEAAMEAAAKKAEAQRFIATLEDPRGRRGYDAYVGERGVKLSGGQRQRIAIARVMLKDAPILVLDEATSALDSEVEAAIQETLYGMMEGKTVIAIAHRLSTIAAMDRIVVMDEGRVIEDGSHEELLALGGVYASLWARQSGGFLGD
ncbi:ABC transporter ATP-binding protein [uncultured Maritimibacter sp.]|jgi:ATP-binding cassette subfamily B multidrug efflux pump|uniref:ABC transporter ATP-binding protein n=1 Tax=uncultured Maritimibacter sp. TaxID=991866 RepID=UPI000A70921A|nr:ABC transporter ATP-binding protein [uncultured Maritimibacter sp.]